MNNKDYTIYSEFSGYRSREDKTNSDVTTVAPGSKNMIIDYNKSIRQRAGIKLAGTDEGSANGGINGSRFFEAAGGINHSLRFYNDKVQRLKKTVSGLTVTYSWETVGILKLLKGYVSATSVYDDERKKNYFVMANGSEYINYWGGSYAVVDTVTATTVKISGTQSLLELGFNPAPTALPVDTIGDITAGSSFTYTGFTTSDATVTAIGNGTFDIAADTFTLNSHQLGEGVPIKFTTTGALPSPLVAGTQYFTKNITTNTFQLALAPGGAVIDLTGTPSGTQTVYKYLGMLDTFAGVTFNGAVSAGDSVTEAIVSTKNSTMDFSYNYTIDYVGVDKNSLYIGRSGSKLYYRSDAVSKGTVEKAFLNFTTSLNVGGARKFTLDDTCAGFIPTKDSLLVLGASDSILNLKSILSADQTKEYIEPTKLAIAPKQGVISAELALRVKNAVVYVTREKTLDTIEFVENISDIQTVPISDIIKSDFDASDFTGATMYYWERNLLIAIKNSGKILIYDLQRKFWQPPIILSGATISEFSIDEDGNLLAHDAYRGATYFMFSGTSDNGSAIESVLRIPINNFGNVYRKKHFSKYFQDGYISKNAVLNRSIELDYEGKTAIIPSSFSGSDSKFISIAEVAAGLGQRPLGERSLAGSPLVPVVSEGRFMFVDSASNVKEFYELSVVYSHSTLNGTWGLVRHGSDVSITDTDNNDIMRDI